MHEFQTHLYNPKTLNDDSKIFKKQINLPHIYNCYNLLL